MPVKTITFYNKLAPVYPIINIFLKPQRNAFIKRINSHPQGKLLEIGVGNGSHLPLYNKHDLIGIDQSRGMLKTAVKNVGNGIRLLEMDGENLSFGEAMFDYVVLSHVIAVTKDPEKMLNEAFRVLKPNGRLFILNHFTPQNALKHLDKIVSPIGKFLHLKSVFYQSDLLALQKFNVVEDETIGMLSYFKILILQKP